MPNGVDVPGGTGLLGPFISLGQSIAGFFGGGKTAFEQQVQAQFDAEFVVQNDRILQKAVRGEPLSAAEAARVPLSQADLRAIRAEQGRNLLTGAFDVPPSEISGRFPIPLPEFGGPELITERIRNLPPIPDVLEFTQGALGFEGISDMAVDVPLLSSFLPAVRQATTPAITGFLGGIAQDILSGFIRPTQELGLGQVPARAPVSQVSAIAAQVGVCPAEKPHTRILRFIKQNTGVSINLSRAKSLIRELGLENAARCLGIGAGEVCSLLIVASPRRRRGISASDIRIVKRTARRFEVLKHDLGHLGGRPGHHHHRRRTTRHK